jgi:hypothetical protein
MDKDYFTLMQFSAKWDPIPVCYVKIIPNSSKVLWVRRLLLIPLIKSNVLIMGSCELNGKHDIFMAKGKGMFTFTEGMIRKTFSIRWGSANGLGFTP